MLSPLKSFPEKPIFISASRKFIPIPALKILLSVVRKKTYLGKNVKIKFVKDRPGHDMRYAINSNKIRKKLGWKPKISFNKGLEKTFEWYCNNKAYYSLLSKKDIIKRIGLKK